MSGKGCSSVHSINNGVKKSSFIYNMFNKLCTGGTEKTSVLQTKSKLIIMWLHYLEEDVSSLVRASGKLCMGLMTR